MWPLADNRTCLPLDMIETYNWISELHRLVTQVNFHNTFSGVDAMIKRFGWIHSDNPSFICHQNVFADFQRHLNKNMEYYISLDNILASVLAWFDFVYHAHSALIWKNTTYWHDLGVYLYYTCYKINIPTACFKCIAFRQNFVAFSQTWTCYYVKSD